MPEERLYVKIVMPKQGVEKKKHGGGGKIKPFGAVTSATRARLVAGLEPVETLLADIPLDRPVLPLKAILAAKALAKSHWRDVLFNPNSCPIIGVGKPGELFLRGSREGIHTLKRRILHGEREQMVKEISAVKELRPIAPEDRLNGITVAKLFSAAPEVRGRRAIKVKLFNYSDPDTQANEVGGFERQLQGKALSFIPHSQYKGQDIYTVTCKTEADVAFLANVLSVRSVGLIPMFRTVREARLNSRPAPNSIFTSEFDPASFPIVGVVDSGVTKDVPNLERWVYSRERFVSAAEENTYHGTFVAGLLVWGHVLNPEYPEIGRHPCRILDIHVLPNSDPTYGAVGSVTESELLQDLEQALLKHSNEVKVWNLSLGSDEVCSLDRFSDFAVQLDNLQERFGVTFVIAAGNYATAPLLSYPRDPRSADAGRITSPADSVLGIAVGAIAQLNHPTSGTQRGEPSPFSRHGPGPNHIIKPDLVHFGGNIGKDLSHSLGLTSLDNGPKIVEDVGTSFATPLVARQLASIHHRITPTPSATLARAILTHNAVDIRTQERVKDGDDHYLGFGTPLGIERALECDPWKMTLVFEEVMRPGYFLEWDSFPYPESLTDGDRFRGEIWMTLAYSPARNPSFGSEYCETHVDAHFGVYRDRKGKEEFSGLVPVEHPNKGILFESFQVQTLRKWAPVRTYHRLMENGVRGKRWRLCVELLCRHGVEENKASNQPFALLLSISDPKKKAPVYDEMVRSLRTRFQTQNLALRPSVRVQRQN
ncbi:MAG: S8 family peptidase [Verrucomicrobia bacterium]|nr:S8 family peptidase [Verrucomicrobiota bacterium]